MSSRLHAWLENSDYGTAYTRQAVAGGCISQTVRLQFKDGRSLFAKLLPDAPADMFPAEAEGLKALGEECGKSRGEHGLRIPQALAVEADFILLEDLGAGRRDAYYWERLGRGLALLHSRPQECFGFTGDNYCGSTPQLNPRREDGFEFFAEHRLLHLARQALDRGLLSSHDLKALEMIAARLPDWIPQQPAVLIHGDLWSGNIHCCDDGSPALIDPAAYWGWAEADLAMTRLFGGFDPRFYGSYEEASAIDSDWPGRSDIYNLYHLLNHLLLFGGSYLSQIQAITARFAAV